MVLASVYRRYTGAEPLFSFIPARPWLSSASWLMFGGLTLLFLTSICLVRRISDFLEAAHGLLAAYFLFSCNAVLLAAYRRHPA
jgi:hypothetical protein